MEDVQDGMSKPEERIEERFRGAIEEMKADIAQRFPFVRPRVSSFVRGATTNQVHALCLECVFLEATPLQADLLALCITTEHLNTHPQVQVDISWGAPSGRVEAELFDTPMDFSIETLNVIERALPKLCEKLISVIQEPINQNSTM